MITCILAAVVLFGPCQGVTLLVSSRYPPPFATSLYRAPQTYDRGRAPRPFIVISRGRPCYGSESARHFGLVKPHAGHRLTTSRPFWSNSEDGRPMQRPAQEFQGNWRIIRPVLKEDLDDRVIKYNKDGTRIVHETLYNYHTRDPQIAINGVSAVPALWVKVHDAKPSTTALPSTASVFAGSITKSTAGAPSTPQKIQLTAQYHISSATTQEVSKSSGSNISSPAEPETTMASTTSAAASTAQTLGPIAVASSYLVHDSSKILVTKTTTSTSTMAPVSVVTSYIVQDTFSTTEPPKSLINKLGGGVQNIFNHIFGGVLNGRHTKEKHSDEVSHGNATLPVLDDQETSSTNTSAAHGSNGTIAEPTGNISEYITKKLPDSFWSQLKFLQEQLEKVKPNRNVSKAVPSATARATTLPVPATSVTVSEPTSPLLSLDEDFSSSTSVHVYDASPTPHDLWPLDSPPENDQQDLPVQTALPTEDAEYSDVTSWMASDEVATDEPEEVPDFMATPSSMLFGKINTHENDGLATSTSGWRPLRRLVPSTDPTRAPAPAPLGIHQWLQGTWNDTSDWWGDRQQNTEGPESTTKTSVRRWFQKVATSGPIPRWSSQTSTGFDVTTYRPTLGLSPIQWLFGSHFPDTSNLTNATTDYEMHEAPDDQDTVQAKEGQEVLEVLDIPTSRIKPHTVMADVSSSAQLLKHAQVVNQSSSINASKVVEETRNSQLRAASDKLVTGGDLGLQTPDKNASKVINSSEVIKQIHRFYKKLKVGLGLTFPLDIIEPLMTMEQESLKAMDGLH